MLSYILSLLFPCKCIVCDLVTDKIHLCASCWSNLSFITRPYCDICGLPFSFEDEEEVICGNCILSRPNYDRACAILKYDQYSKKLIHKFKYQDKLHITEYLADFFIKLTQEYINNADLIIPVPIHRYKLLKRGYNQTALLARQIACKSSLEYVPDVLIKTIITSPQTGLKKIERIKNIKNSFGLNPEMISLIKNKRIILLDDVITTGATINECARTLRKGKPREIVVISLAKKY